MKNLSDVIFEESRKKVLQDDTIETKQQGGEFLVEPTGIASTASQESLRHVSCVLNIDSEV